METEFKYIYDKELYDQDMVLEIAYQLKRIADKL